MNTKTVATMKENPTEFIGEISQLISSSKQRMAVAVNAELTSICCKASEIRERYYP